MQELFFAGILLVVSGVLMTCVRAAVEHYRIFNSGVPVNACIIEQTGIISWRRTYIKVMWEYETTIRHIPASQNGAGTMARRLVTGGHF